MAVFDERNHGGQEMSEYEKMVQQNIFENQFLFANEINECKRSARLNSIVHVSNSTNDVSTSKGEPRKRSYNQKLNQEKVVSKDASTFIRRSARINVTQIQNYNENSDDDDDDGEEQISKKSRKGSLRLKFDFFAQNKKQLRDEEFYSALNDSDFVDFDDEEFEQPRTRRRSSVRIPRLAVTEVTQSMLDKVVYRSSNKVYGTNGTTCHQCRQKTLDQKSYCRHKNCRGARGMFCGFCLYNRYGENVAVVLKNPRWACPPCRGHCNCSICRRRGGLNPTGQMAQLAEARGFKSVFHLLNNVKGESSEQSTSNVSDDENEDKESYEQSTSNLSDDDENEDKESSKNFSSGVSDDDKASEERKRKQEEHEEELRQMWIVIFGEENPEHTIGRKSVKDFDHEKENKKLVDDHHKELVDNDSDNDSDSNLNYIPKALKNKYALIFDKKKFY